MLPAAFSPILGAIIYGSQIIQVKYGQSGTSACAYFHLVTVFLIWKCHIFYLLSDTRTFKSKWSTVVMCVTSERKAYLSIYHHHETSDLLMLLGGVVEDFILPGWFRWSNERTDTSWQTPAALQQTDTHTRMSSDHNDCSACHFSPWGSCAHAATGRGHDGFVVGIYCSFTEPLSPPLYSHKALDLGLL